MEVACEPYTEKKNRGIEFELDPVDSEPICRFNFILADYMYDEPSGFPYQIETEQAGTEG